MADDAIAASTTVRGATNQHVSSPAQRMTTYPHLTPAPWVPLLPVVNKQQSIRIYIPFASPPWYNSHTLPCCSKVSSAFNYMDGFVLRSTSLQRGEGVVF